MRRQPLTIAAATLALGAGGALAQGGDLSGVTMRVLDDLSDVDAVVLELDASRGESEQGAEAERRATERTEAQERATAPPSDEAGRDERPELRPERDDLHDAADDERSEGRLEDRDVERPAAAPSATP